jgi:phenylalanyl-tRNA synthetase beta chain
MKVSIGWIREWARVRASDAQLAERLTLAGIECEAEPHRTDLRDVVVGLIRDVQPHPQADRLRVCTVDAGGKQPLTIVCGAANARAGMKAPVALPGAALPDGTAIKQAALRGVESAGMLCSAKELGLAEKSEGLLELDADAKVGVPVAKHLALDDAILVLELTPNRGDCLSVLGLARELAALYGLTLTGPAPRAPTVASTKKYAIRIDATRDCPHYAGRAIEGIDPRVRTPDWLRERLRRSGLRAIHPVVDVTNYVMLELGQPLHAFDCAQLHGAIRVRRAKAGEALALLNEQTVELTPADLLIADDRGALALAGVMGGAKSGVTAQTTEIFIESACFAPERVAATGRRLRLPSDALYRFERGVDPTLQRAALERASELIVAICGGRAGPVTEAGARRPKPVTVRLRRARLDQLLGHAIPDRDVEALLKRLGIGMKRIARAGWHATVPGHRYDLRLEVDLIEEVARMYGYDRIPARPYAAPLTPAPVPERQPAQLLRERLAARGYFEAITYSFVDAALQRQLAPDVTPVPLDNPLADTMTQMRATLWSGLIPAWQYNQQRQQKRVRLFEAGVCFGEGAGAVAEQERVALIAAGPAAPEQWGVPARPVDFFDVKADLEALFAGVGGLRFEAAQHPALHPGRSARIVRDGAPAGWLGALHPRLVQALDLAEAPILAEVEMSALQGLALPHPAEPPEFPSSRRDLALVLRDEVPAADLLAQARGVGGPLLRAAGVFDVYRGAGLPNGFKSVALSLIFQDNSRTLTDEEVDAAVQAVARRLQEAFGATIRGESSGGVDQGGTGRSAV